MTRREALLAALMVPQTPYYPGQPAQTWVTLDFSKLEQVTIRLPQGMVTYSSKELWEALKK